MKYSMKYKEKARKDFEEALVEYKVLAKKISSLESVIQKDNEKVNTLIDNFLGGLDFNIYCEDYILCMTEHVGEVLNNKDISDEEHNDNLSLICLILSSYAEEHKRCITKDFIEVCTTTMQALELAMLVEMYKSFKIKR